LKTVLIQPDSATKTPLQAATIALVLSMTSALLSADIYHNWPAEALVENPGSWALVSLPGG
jgi:hypothetical protein